MSRLDWKPSLLFVGLALVTGLTACGSDSTTDAGVDAGADTGTPPVDTGTPPVDTGTPPVDTGTPPVDAGMGTDTGTPPVDTGTPPVDTGTPPVDTGTPPVDTGTPPVDTGTPPVDVGTPPTDAGTPPTDRGFTDALVPTDFGPPPTDGGFVDVFVATDFGPPMDAGFVDVGGTMDIGPPPADAGFAQTDTASVADSGPVADTGRTSVQVGGTFSREGMPIVGATVVVVDRPGATVTTGSNGGFAFTLPVGSTQVIRASATDLKTVQSALVVPGSDVLSFSFRGLPSAQFAGALSAIGITENTAQGALLLHFNTIDTTPAGFGATLNVSGGTRFLVTSSGPMRRDTTLAGDGTLIIANVPAGTVTVTPVPPSGITCSPTYGVRAVRVDARVITDLTFDCR